MWPALLVCQLVLILQSEAQSPCLTHPTFRDPDNSDITVMCGTNRMDLYILLCPMYFYGYNESMVALNGHFAKPECRGTADWTANPPVLKFQFYITEPYISICSNKLTITQEVGSGLFSDFSSVQSVNISGVVNTQDPNAGTITYRQEMKYLFSCRYPLQYLINNTEMSVSGVSLAIKDNNGSFISTLSMLLFEDYTYTTRLFIPPTGLMLKTRVFVEVRATNLTERFNVLLDRCYTTTNPYPGNSTSFDLFVGCNHDLQTIMGVNGEQQVARFSFETFRFVEHRNRTVSTFYLHCTTRLCESSFCRSLRQNCSTPARKRREVQSAQGTSVSDVATVSSGPVITKVDEPFAPVAAASEAQNAAEAVVGVSVAAGVFGALCVIMLAMLVYKIRRDKFSVDKSTLFH
ncbi:zona pellucida-like domain-containing protein 1 [Ctenopharyngodon idella]|uniref:zona pellucida-like domain-containing protein 1 n=1 Tax=Ctenopharyngodon idella TaxID=7959 RepID=UPI00222E46CB|nr:zona pellucida-like domain-containing protein 1 [Ctenopharyngodon idella]XP_051766912.1 zona pellucida-like domain-containing protein 1 [Ctenopharyngodon idella]XP_051766913.1 zona pellucida-like domain-containing protein 1 [Ctenopharyngodon idella]